MKLRGLLLGILGVLLVGFPANAGQLISWEFEKDENRLVFITDEGVQPRAKLIGDPTRLVIELPGTTLNRTTIKETYSGAIRGFRIGQSTDNVVSLVIELAPGYTIDPSQVQFRGLTPTEWTVDIPSPRISDLPPRTEFSNQPERTIRTAPTATELPRPKIERATLDNDNRVSVSSSSNLTKSPYVKTTSHGFFLDINGDRGRNSQILSTRNGDSIDFELQGVTLPSDLVSQSVAVNEFGVEEISFAQSSPTVATVSLKVSPDSPEWRAIFSRINGLILVPGGSRTIIQSKPPELTNKLTDSKQSDSRPNNLMTTIHAIDLTENDSQLSIRSNGDLTATSRLVDNGTYEVIIDNARLDDPFAGPQLRINSPITQLKVREERDTVVVSITTKLGTRLGTVQNGTNLIALPIIIPPTAISVPSPNRPLASTKKPLVIIDPGHGGQDPGTIGIGGIQEKNVVLPISLDVVEELKKQGIEVRLTRDQDYFISLEGRTDMANEVNADLFVSIHANAINLSRPDVSGLETYYYQSGRRLAEIIHYNILNSVDIQDRNIRRARFYVLRHSEMPAVLVEVGFLTGAEDASNLKNPEHRRQMAKAIARGIVQYIKENRI